MNRHLLPTATVLLKDVAALNPQTPRLSPTEEVAFVPMASVSEEGSMAAETTSAADLKPGFSYFQNSDVLVAKITPCYENNKIAVAKFTQNHGFGSTEFHVLRPTTEALDSRYLAHYLRQDSIRRAGERRMTGSGGQRRVPRQFLEELPVFLPPLDEQRRIAAILDQADDLRRKSRVALERLHFLASTLFRSLFGNQVRNERHLPESTIGALGVEMTYGPRYHNEEYSKDGVRIVRITDLREDGSLDWEAMPKLTLPQKELDRSAACPGELLFARTGATVGKLALIKNTDPICVPGAYFIRMKFPASIDPTYAWYALRSDEIQAIVVNGSRQSAQQNFSGPGLRRLPFLIPSLDLQKNFASRIAEIDELKASHRVHLTHLDALFSSLQHRAFSGEL